MTNSSLEDQIITVDESRPVANCPLKIVGSELARRRKALRMTQQDLAVAIYSTQAMVSYIERAVKIASEDLVGAFDAALQYHGLLPVCYEMAKAHPHALCLTDFWSLEAQAISVRSYATTAVPSLLQTAAYARAVALLENSGRRRYRVARTVGRQKLIFRPEVDAWFVISETALRCTAGDSRVMGDQLQYLYRLASGEDPTIVIQVIPDGVPMHAATDSPPFTLYKGKKGPTLLHATGLTARQNSVDQREVTNAEWIFDLLRATAATQTESADIILRHLSRPRTAVVRGRAGGAE